MRHIFVAVLGWMALLTPAATFAQNLAGATAATIVSKDNRVDVARGGAGWSNANAGETLNLGDRLRTGEESRATVRISDGSVLQLDELTTIEIQPPKTAGTKETLSMSAGAVYFFGRSASREVRFETPSANGAIRGTAFLLKVTSPAGQTAVSMLDGAFDLSNAGANVLARAGDQAVALPQGAPAKKPLSELGNTAPWYLVVERDLTTASSLHRASKGAVLGALPRTITQWRRFSSQFAGSATIVRQELARDILRVSFSAVGGDCGAMARILRSVVAADPAEASALTEMAVSLAPQCAGSFKPSNGPGGGPGNEGNENGEETENGEGNTPPQALDLGGQFFNRGSGQGSVVAICHNGMTLFLSPADAERQLQNNRGDTLGPCQVTPAQNR